MINICSHLNCQSKLDYTVSPEGLALITYSEVEQVKFLIGEIRSSYPLRQHITAKYGQTPSVENDRPNKAVIDHYLEGLKVLGELTETQVNNIKTVIKQTVSLKLCLNR